MDLIKSGRYIDIFLCQKKNTKTQPPFYYSSKSELFTGDLLQLYKTSETFNQHPGGEKRQMFWAAEKYQFYFG